MTPVEQRNRWMLRARDAIDRDFAEPLDVPALARVAHVSPSHFSRTFRDVVGESPTGYRRSTRPLAGMVCFHKAWLRPSSFGEARMPPGRLA
jgi:AraC-like DNA-binding protein